MAGKESNIKILIRSLRAKVADKKVRDDLKKKSLIIIKCRLFIKKKT